MKLYILITALIATFFCTLVSTASIPYQNLNDLDIAQLFLTKETVGDNTGEIIYPPNYATWYVGEPVNITFKNEDPTETVAIFFFNKSELLAGGPLTQTVFDFVVPPSAVSGPHDASLLLAVRRENYHLQTVDGVMVHVLPAKS